MGYIRNKLKNIKLIREIYIGLCGLTPRNIAIKLNEVRVRSFDRRHGTDFSGRLYQNEIGTSKDRANDYSPTPIYELVPTIKKYAKDNERILDLGCGKGFAMQIMSRYGFKKIGGVELSKKLSEIARYNLAKIMPTNIEWNVYCMDASMFKNYDEYDIFYIYNSFPEKVMEEVKDRIYESFLRHQRKIQVWYLNPEFADVFFSDNKWRFVRKGSRLRLRCGMHIFELNP